MNDLTEAPVEEQVTNAVEVVNQATESLDTKHKVLFYVLMGLLVITPVGVVLAILYIRKLKKQNKQLTDQVNGTAAATETPATPAEEPKAENPATPEKKK